VVRFKKERMMNTRRWRVGSCIVQALFLSGLLCLLPPGVSGTYASEADDPGALGSGEAGGSPIAQPRSELFDDSDTFVRPEELPIVDVYEKEMQRMDAAELAEMLEAVSVTPEGVLESLPVAVEEAAEFMEALKSLETLDTEYEGAEADVSAAGDADDGGPLAESVIGADTRTRVYNTTKYPFRTVGRIDIGCTGTLIGKRHVLTAGHCVYNIGTDKWYSKLNFTPGQNGSSKPYGTISWKRAITVKGWTRDHKRNYDYAMIVLKKDIGNTTGWMGYGWKKPMPKYNVNINGYPGDKPFGTMWHSYCQLQIIRPRRLYYACDTYGGMSGSGVYVYWRSKNKRTIYGIHAYGVDSTGYNGATRITGSVFKNLYKWKRTY
jgi:V8-like Glu-specific endopeptidase